MQEEVENRTVAITTSAAKFTGRLFKAAICKYLEHRKNVKVQKANKARASPVIPHGKQTVKPDEQKMLLDTIESEQATPSLSQAQRLKKLSQSGDLTDDAMLKIMSEQKKTEKNDLTIPADVLEKYFPRSFTPMKMQEVIIKLLESWQKRRQQSHER